MQSGRLNMRKRMKFALMFSVILFIIILGKIASLQIINGKELKEEAYVQRNFGRSINPKRGTIYDRTGEKILAVSATVETVSIVPVNISKDNKEKVARIISEIFELDYEKVLKKVNKRTSIEIIKRRVDKEKTDLLREWMKGNNIYDGINIDEDTKRYYPYSTLASHVLGFCGSDNQGLNGIEAKYDEILKGEKGKIEKMVDGRGFSLEKESEYYTAAVDGKNIVISIDAIIQSIAEKYLEKACIDNVCTDGGNVILMSPKTGDILAMATYPNYNLNSPFEINKEELKKVWNEIDSNKRNENLQAMWRNKAISDTYEPGSTFKLVTTAGSIEEGITDTDKNGEFVCSGRIDVSGTTIKCWRYYRPHGAESLRQGLMNSCNPVFISLGQKMGIDKYYSYLEKFGFLSKTGIDLPGEAKGIFLAKEKVGPVELATISFGQRFEVTPIQMITMMSTIANNGIKINPRIVTKIIDSKTGEIDECKIKTGERVISEETSKKVLSMMESVVSEGTGKNAKVEGFSVGGKTGTSEDGVNTGKYVTSFMGVAPIEDPEVAILITLYNPTGEGGHQGGSVAAPIASEILGEVLPYMQDIGVID